MDILQSHRVTNSCHGKVRWWDNDKSALHRSRCCMWQPTMSYLTCRAAKRWVTLSFPTLSWSVTLSGQCCQLSDKLEDKPVPWAQGERGEYPQGRGRGQNVPRRAGEVPHNGRVSEEAVSVPEADSQDLRHLGHVLEGALGGRGGPARALQGRGRTLELSLQVKTWSQELFQKLFYLDSSICLRVTTWPRRLTRTAPPTTWGTSSEVGAVLAVYIRPRLISFINFFRPLLTFQLISTWLRNKQCVILPIEQLMTSQNNLKTYCVVKMWLVTFQNNLEGLFCLIISFLNLPYVVQKRIIGHGIIVFIRRIFRLHIEAKSLSVNFTARFSQILFFWFLFQIFWYFDSS